MGAWHLPLALSHSSQPGNRPGSRAPNLGRLGVSVCAWANFNGPQWHRNHLVPALGPSPSPQLQEAEIWALPERPSFQSHLQPIKGSHSAAPNDVQGGRSWELHCDAQPGLPRVLTAECEPEGAYGRKLEYLARNREDMGRRLLQSYLLQILEQGWWQTSSPYAASDLPVPRAGITSRLQHFPSCMWTQPQNPPQPSFQCGHYVS